MGLNLFQIISILSAGKIDLSKAINVGGRACLLLGNGPSLLDSLAQNPKLFDKCRYASIAMNLFSTSEIYEKICPEIYVLSSHEFWRDEELPHHQEISRKIFTSIRDKTQWPLLLLIGSEAKKYQGWKRNIEGNPNIRIQYFSMKEISGESKLIYWLITKGYGLFPVQNVLMSSLVLSIVMGFCEIYLLGAEHSWTSLISIDENNNLLIGQKHFYNDTNQPMKFMPTYADKKARTLHSFLYKLAKTFEGYHAILKYADYRNAKVYNATLGSFIDAFERRMPG